MLFRHFSLLTAITYANGTTYIISGLLILLCLSPVYTVVSFLRNALTRILSSKFAGTEA